MDKTIAKQYTAFALDDALALRDPSEAPEGAVYVGWQCGFEPLFVAVWSYLPGVRLDEGEAEDIARDYLLERGWFSDPSAENWADFIVT